MQKSNIGENPQGTEIELAYFAGLWDGEGYIGVTRVTRKSNLIQYIPKAQIINTNPVLIESLISVLDKYTISAWIFSHDDENPKHKVSYRIDITKLTALQKLLDLLIPYLKGKKEVAILTKRFVDARLKIGKNGNQYHSTYDEEQISLYDQLKKLNRKGPSETIRETS